MNPWPSSAMSPHGNSYDLVVVLAETRHEAIASARAAIEAGGGSKDFPAQWYAANLLENHGTQMAEAPSASVAGREAVRPPQ